MIPDLGPCPPQIAESIQKYLKDGIRPGGFVVAVLENNLKETVVRADENNLPLIPAIVGYVLDHAPANTWGSPALVTRHIEKKFREYARKQLQGEA